MKLELSAGSKEAIARLGNRWPFDRLIALAVRIGVARHRVGVGLVTFDANGRVLLFRHVLRPAFPWGLPGGWLNRNESPESGLIREMREETGLEAVLGPPILVEYGKYPPHIVIIYLGWLRPGTLHPNYEINEARWFAPDDLPNPLPYLMIQAIKKGLTLWKTTPIPPASAPANAIRTPIAGKEVRPLA